jgi:hypothetical protein
MTILPAQFVKFLRKGFSPLIIIAVVAVVAVLGVGGFFAFNMVNTPAKVKEKAGLVHPIFVQHKETVDKIIDHLKEDTGSDSDSLERAALKSKDLAAQAEKEKTNLDELVKTMNIGELAPYKKLLDDYLALSVKLTAYEKDSGNLMDSYVRPIKDYETLTVKLRGASSYMYSDPDKYLSLLSEGITEEEAVLAKFKKIDSTYFAKYNDQFIKTIENEIDYLKTVKMAVENRRLSELATATQKYASNSQENRMALRRVIEQINDEVKSLASKATSTADQVGNEYNRLRTKYNF